MQHDEVVWQVIRHNHCSFMAKIETGIFCKNEYNVTGICNRSSCPLANSRYATIREHDGVFYLYMKTIERSHMPNKLWERVKLPRNYEKALEIIDKHLMYWPKFLVHKTKQRLTKMTQMRIRMRKLFLKTREKLMTMPRKQGNRDIRREEKAREAALLEDNITKELEKRRETGVYGSIYNSLDNEQNKEVASEDEFASEDEDEYDLEYVEGFEEEDDMEDIDGLGIRELEEDDNEDEDDEEAVTIHMKRGEGASSVSQKKLQKDGSRDKSKKKARLHVEVEHEETSGRKTSVQ